MGNVLKQHQQVGSREQIFVTTYWVDQMMRYIPELATTLRERYAQ
jgi:hypothetical protein